MFQLLAHNGFRLFKITLVEGLSLVSQDKAFRVGPSAFQMTEEIKPSDSRNSKALLDRHDIDYLIGVRRPNQVVRERLKGHLEKRLFGCTVITATVLPENDPAMTPFIGLSADQRSGHSL